MSNEIDLKKLKSGSDIRGTAGEMLNEKTIAALVAGFQAHINAKTIALGHDSRLSGPMLAAAASAALLKQGVNVNFCGLCSTPSMFMTTILNDVDGAIMLTASHHPKDKNGIKFFVKSGGVTSSELDQIILKAQEILNRDSLNNDGKISAKYVERDFLEDYCVHMRNVFLNTLKNMPLDGFKVVVDAGCGSAGFYADRILSPLKIDTSGSQYLTPDGNFPAHPPNPENVDAMQSISNRVLETRADLGIIFDADGDRAAVVLPDGTPVNRNRLIALITAIIFQQGAGTVVTDSVTSEGLTEFIEHLGGKHVRYKRGYQNVISYAKELNLKGEYTPIAIETSGHAALKSNYFLDDGAYLAALIIIEAVKAKRQNRSLLDLIKDLKEPLEEGEFRLKLSGEDWKDTGQNAIEALTQASKGYKFAQSFEGIRVYVKDKDFFMARMSVHDPIIAINIESYNQNGLTQIKQIVHSALKDINNIDLTPLTQ